MQKIRFPTKGRGAGVVRAGSRKDPKVTGSGQGEMAGLVRSGTGFFTLRHHHRFPFMRSFVTVECDGKRERKRVKRQVEQKMQKKQKENLRDA